MVLEEVYRFPNGMKDVDGEKLWDIPELFGHIKAGMKKCAELGKIPYSMGIDTWAVDFVLLDKDDRILGKTYGYRDGRTGGMDQEVYKVIPEKELYYRTGIQKQIFNTIYQLMAVKINQPQDLAQAQTMLMIPDYFHFLLTGRKVQEYTNASTTQLVHPVKKNWDYKLIEELGFPRRIFRGIALPGYELGHLLKGIQEEVGYNCKVVLPGTHDTASAVIAVPSVKEASPGGEALKPLKAGAGSPDQRSGAENEDVLYISSGTWSLMGTELKEAICTEESRQKNLTNEGGYGYRFRYLKNIMGMWMINSARAEIAKDMGFADICDQASKETIASLVPVNDARFLAPKSMVSEVQAACRESGQQVPEGIAQVAAAIYNSLAKCYADTADEIEAITGKKYDCIHIVGGGSNADYLNRLTAKASGRTVYTGPGEATAIGNIAVQCIASGELKDLANARKCIFDSFGIKKYEA